MPFEAKQCPYWKLLGEAYQGNDVEANYELGQGGFTFGAISVSQKQI
jgi:hypothetical protein